MRKCIPDERISKLSYAAFEAEFGFKPANKIEQKLFALRGRKPDPRVLAFAERVEAKKAEAPV